MIRILCAIFLITMQLSFSSFADKVSDIKSDLEGLFKAALLSETFFVHVSGTYKNEDEKKLLENEIYRQKKAEQQKPEIQPMPGFDVAPPGEIKNIPEEFSKEVYNMISAQVLDSVAVQAFYDEKTDKQLVEKLKTAVKAYLTTLAPVKYTFGFTPIFVAQEALPPSPTETVPVPMVDDRPWWFWPAISAVVVLLLLLMFMLLRRLLKNEQPQARKASDLTSDVSQGSSLVVEDNTQVMRSDLLHRIIEKAPAFQSYFTSLDKEKKAALVSHLSSPAFNSIVKALRLDLSEVENETASSDYDVAFFKRDFADYTSAATWQQNQFFGFLHQIDNGKLIALYMEQKPFDLAVMTRFLAAERVAEIFSKLSKEKRAAIMQQFTAASKALFNDVANVENSLRTVLETLPSIGEQLNKRNVDFWADVVMNSADQDQVLADIQTSLPELYPTLSKLRFKLEDIPTFPKEIVARVLSELDNQQLALALSNMSDDVVGVILDSVAANRRPFIVSQMSSLGGASDEQIRLARAAMAAEFRKVMT